MDEYATAADAMEQAVEMLKRAGSSEPRSFLFEYADALVLADQLDRALEVAEGPHACRPTNT